MPAQPDPVELYQVKVGSYYRGRFADRKLIGKTIGIPVSEHNWKHPPEDPEDGCPGAWYRSQLVDDLDRYYRRRTEAGGRVSNPQFTHADWLVQQAILYLEGEEERWHAYIRAERADRAELAEKRRERDRQTTRNSGARRRRR